MSTGRRAYDLLRGYVNQEWERIRTVHESDDERELREAVEMNTSRVESTTNVQEVAIADPQEWARKILGVSATADFVEIRKSFERLNSRSDPSKFPSNSPEAKQAAEIQMRVRQAYAILSEAVDTTEKRFKSLEID